MHHMNFYTLEYITANQSFNLVARSAVLIILLGILFLTGIRYMGNRIRTRLRDISIGIVVLTFILLGVQVEEYMENNLSVATDNNISPDDVLVNSTTLRDGIIVRYNEEDYTVHLNKDNNSYTLQRTHVIDHNVYINGER